MATRKSFSDAFASSYGKGGFAEGMEAGLKNKIAKETKVLERSQKLKDRLDDKETDISEVGLLDRYDANKYDTSTREGLKKQDDYAQSIINQGGLGKRLKNAVEMLDNLDKIKSLYPDEDTDSIVGEITTSLKKDMGDYADLDKVINSPGDVPGVGLTAVQQNKLKMRAAEKEQDRLAKQETRADAIDDAIDKKEGVIAAERHRDFARVNYKLGLLNRRSASGYKQMMDDLSNNFGIEIQPGRGLASYAGKVGLKVAQLAGYGEYHNSAIGLTTEIGTSLMRLSIKARSGYLADKFMKSIKTLSGNPYQDITMLTDSWSNAYGEELVAGGLRGQELEDELIKSQLNMFGKMSSAYMEQGVIDKPISGGFTENQIIKYYEPTQREVDMVAVNLEYYKKINPDVTEEQVKRAMYQKGQYFGGR